MQKILRIDSSSRVTGSQSRELGDYFETKWKAARPDGQLVRRDLAKEPIEQIRQDTITGFYTPADGMTAELKTATARSDKLIGEVQAADTLLITAPIYNFGVPASLKAWIDQVVRIGHTFSFDGANFGGLAKPDTVIVCAAYGASGYEEGGPFRAANFLEPYLDFLLKFLGVSTIRFIAVQATTADSATADAGMVRAKADIDDLIASVAASR